MLNDKEFEPVLIGPQAGVKLIVPTPDKVGQLRPSSTPEMGKSCWMSFSNKGRVVQPRDRVNIVAGRFRLDGLRWISRHFSQSRRWSPVGYRPVGFGGRFRGVMMRLGWSRRA